MAKTRQNTHFVSVPYLSWVTQPHYPLADTTAAIPDTVTLGRLQQATVADTIGVAETVADNVAIADTVAESIYIAETEDDSSLH